MPKYTSPERAYKHKIGFIQYGQNKTQICVCMQPLTSLSCAFLGLHKFDFSSQWLFSPEKGQRQGCPQSTQRLSSIGTNMHIQMFVEQICHLKDIFEICRQHKLNVNYTLRNNKVVMGHFFLCNMANMLPAQVTSIQF